MIVLMCFFSGGLASCYLSGMLLFDLLFLHSLSLGTFCLCLVFVILVF